MKNKITLTKETIEILRNSYKLIDEESEKLCNDCNIDIITENQFKILDIVRELVVKN